MWMAKMTNLLYFLRNIHWTVFTPNFVYMIRLFIPGINENEHSVIVLSRLAIGSGGRSQPSPIRPDFLNLSFSIHLPNRLVHIPLFWYIFVYLSRDCGFLTMAFASINRTPVNKKLSIPAIEEAFAAEPLLKERVYDAIGAYNRSSKRRSKIQANKTTSL